MATKERTSGKLLRFPRGDSVDLSRRAFLRAAERAVGFLLGAILAGGELFGLYAPFGVAAVAAAGSGSTGFCTLAGACLGYLCTGGLEEGMRYAAASILVYSVAFAFYDTRVYQTAWFMPAIAALLSAMTGFVCRGGQGWHGEDLLFFATEVALTALAAAGYTIIFTEWPRVLDGPEAISSRQGAGLLLLGGTLLMSLGRVELLETFSLGRLVAAVAILAAARCGVGQGVLVGACSGVALDLAAGKDPLCSTIFTLSGLACGLLRDRGKGPAALVYIAVTWLASLWLWDGSANVGLPLEAVGASVIFLLLPLKDRRTAPSQKVPSPAGEGDTARYLAAKRMGELAEAFSALHKSLREALRPEDANTEDPAAVFTRAADRVCRACVLSAACWQKEYQATRDAMNRATGPMMARGRCLATDFDGAFSHRCVHFPELLAEINRELTAFLRRRQALRRSRETRQALCSQYETLDALMSRAAAELAQELTPDLPRQGKLDGYLRSMNLTGGLVYYDKAGRLLVETPVTEELRTKPVRRELSRVLGVPLRAPEEDHLRLRFLQAEPFRAQAGVAGAAREGEGISGDTAAWFRREDGTLFLLLCDGMGSGPQAKEESGQAARLVESFLQAGMDPDQALETVSTALALRGEACASVTVDLLSIDLYTGRCRLSKLGAAPTYIRRGDKIKRAAGASLPAGLMPGEHTKPAGHTLRAQHGDWLVMVTDGILGGRDDDWLRDMLARTQTTIPGELAQCILQAAPGRGEDDGTVIAVLIGEGTEP